MKDASHGIAGYAIAGWASLAMVVFATVAMIGSVGLNADSAAPLVMVFLGFGGVGAAMLRKYYGTRRFRLAAIGHQVPCEGRVHAHGRAFNPFSSTRSHTLVVRYQDGPDVRQTAIKVADAASAQRFPPGSLVQGWRHPDGGVYFPIQ